MNKKIALGLALSLLAVLLCGAGIYAAYSNRDNPSQSPVHVKNEKVSPVPDWAANVVSQSELYGINTIENFVYFINKGQIGNFRTVSYRNHKIMLVYSNTENYTQKDRESGRLFPAERPDNYGIYDMYTDEQGSEYRFLYNTDILCGMTCKVEVDPEIHINKDQAAEMAKEYLFTVFPKEAVDAYVLESCAEYEYSPEYSITFYKPLGGYKTDDEIDIRMYTDGRVISFSAPKFSRYDRFQDAADKIDREKNRIAFEATLEAGPESTFKGTREIRDGHVTLTQKGELAFYYDVHFTATTGMCGSSRYWQPIDLG